MTATPVRPVGRPRDEQADAALMAATVALIREVGYDALTMDAVATRAGVARTTLYRRWRTKADLAAAAIEGIMRRTVAIPDSGDAEADLLALMVGATRMYRDPATAELLAGFVSAMARSDRIAAAVRDGFVATWRRAVRAVLERAAARGALVLDVDVELVVDLLASPPFFRAVITGAPVDDVIARDVVRVVLRAFAAPPSSRGLA